MEFHFLGTGAGLPSKQRNVSGLAVRFLQRKSAQWLFDCGEATQHQLLDSPITLTKIDKIFISHLHGDHIFGLPGLLCSRSAQGATTPLTIFGPYGVQAFVETALSVSSSYLSFDVEYVIVQEGTIFADEMMSVEALEIDHVIPSYAFRLTEADRPGTLQVERLQEIGIAPGPVYQKIQRGEVVKLPNGAIVNGRDYLGPAKKGRTVIVAGDTRLSEKMKTFADAANLLIHEGTFRADKQEHAQRFGHSTITEAASLAREADVEHLIITHISSRYAEEEKELELEAKSIFPAARIAYDGMIFKL
ncbi:ribonuclease Z [Alkalihalobacillus oceani]|uniref:ribonuclease Z n=1 Tax=Halalkalibacter oceani TaxID=1653776 RepID=UPI00203DB515|nr:ribonuclease Z [Halalkalibacter oceani]MCM3761280.1 ribonuclease Z [Halalkalibacter oceani]